MRVEWLRLDPKGVVLHVEGIADRDAATTLNGLNWYEPREAFAPLADDEVYIVDLVGAQVRTEDGARVGTVTDVLQVGPTDLIVVRDGRREHLVPNVDDFVVRVDPDAGEVVIRPIEGLLEGWDATKKEAARDESSS